MTNQNALNSSLQIFSAVLRHVLTTNGAVNGNLGYEDMISK